jgi:hypothetical protein
VAISARAFRDAARSGRAAYGRQILATMSQDIDRRVRGRFQLPRAHAHGSIRGVDDRRANSRDAVTRIELELLPIKEPLAPEFYAEVRRIERLCSSRYRGRPWTILSHR